MAYTDLDKPFEYFEEEVGQLILEKLAISKRICVPPDRMRFRMQYGPAFAHEIVAHLEAYFYSEKTDEQTHTVSVAHPKTWWDAFKCEHFPDWLLERYPPSMTVKSETVTFTAKAVFPKFAIAYPDHGKDFRYVTMKRMGF